MLDFEFCIDTGNAKTTCCRQPKYGVHEGKIMSKNISNLEHNNWIRDCTGPWGALILLAANHARIRVHTLISLFGDYVLVTESLMV